MLPAVDMKTAQVIQEFIRDAVKRAGVEGVVLGVSGGVDSALTLKLCCDAVGPSNVHAVLMPENGVTKDDQDASELIEQLGAQRHRYEIGEVVNLVREMTGFRKQRTIANIKPRVRMMLLYAIANEMHLLVAGTSNKSEFLTGYYTKYGDGASDICPIGDLYKTQVWQLASLVGIPEKFIEKKPTAGLWEGQTDEGELGISYRELDEILYAMELGADAEEAARRTGIELNQVRRVFNMVKETRHKRMLQPIPKIGYRTLGVDWQV